MRRESLEDILDTLRSYDTVLIVDDSTSMTLGARWDEVGLLVIKNINISETEKDTHSGSKRAFFVG